MEVQMGVVVRKVYVQPRFRHFLDVVFIPQGRKCDYPIDAETLSAIQYKIDMAVIKDDSYEPHRRLSVWNRSPMTIWRLNLVRDPERANELYEWMDSHETVAVGWGGIGDLNDLSFTSQSELSEIIFTATADKNHLSGGRSLWNLQRQVNVGDVVIVSAGRRKFALRVTGAYLYAGSPSNYEHQRKAEYTPVDANELWELAGGAAASQNAQTALVRGASPISSIVYDSLLSKAGG